MDHVLGALPARQGHFRLESGYHTDLWFSLDALFLSPRDIAPQVMALAGLLQAYEPSAICGPLLGGAFLAQAVASHLGVRFYFCQPAQADTTNRLFAAEYRLPPGLRQRVRNERIAIVDDIISAGSSVRATAAALDAAGAATIVVGCLLLLGDHAVEHFAGRGVPLVSLGRRAFNLWAPDQCPLCIAGASIEDPMAGTP